MSDRRKLTEIEHPLDYSIWVTLLLCGCVAVVAAPDYFVAGAKSLTNTATNLPGKAVEGLRSKLPSWVPGSTQTTTSTKVTAIRRAIVGQESGGNFLAVNRHSRALGYGQVMPFNLPSWTNAVIGREVGEAEFLNSPSIQIRTIDRRMSLYWSDCKNKYGSDRETVRCVAAKWYSGRGYMKDNYQPQYYQGHRYPSIGDYADSVYAKYQREMGK